MATPDLTPDHLSWIVEGRSDNQRSTIALYRLLHDHKIKLNGNPEYYQAAMELAAIAFSLWRAVFLSDTTGEFADQAADVDKFLVSLISDNAVIYSTDKNSRNWSFRYYIDNSMYRLGKLTSDLKLIDVDDFQRPVETEKDEWSHAQHMLAGAVSKLTQLVQDTPD